MSASTTSAATGHLLLPSSSVPPAKAGSLQALPAEIILRIFRQSLNRPSSSFDPNLWLRREQLIDFALVSRHWTPLALHLLRQEPLIRQSTPAGLLTKRVAESLSLRRSVQRWSMRMGRRNGGAEITIHPQLEQALPKFRNLTTLAWDGGILDVNLLAELRNLTTLRLRNTALCIGYMKRGASDVSVALLKLRNLTLLDILGDSWAIIQWENMFTQARFPALTSISVGRTEGDLNDYTTTFLWRQFATLPLTSITLYDLSYSHYTAIKPYWSSFKNLKHLTIHRHSYHIAEALPLIPRPLNSLTLMPALLPGGQKETYCDWRDALKALRAQFDGFDTPISISSLERITVHVDGQHRRSQACSCNHDCARCPDGKARLASLREVYLERGIELVRVKGNKGRRGGPLEEWWTDRRAL